MRAGAVLGSRPVRWILSTLLSGALLAGGAAAAEPPRIAPSAEAWSVGTPRAAAPRAAASTTATPSAQVSEAAVDALIFDLWRIVAAEEDEGWLLDDTAQNSLHPALMHSVCRAAPALREEALARVEKEAATLGDPRALYELAQRTLAAPVVAALSAQRRVAALQRANASAASECPFWVHPDPEFRGLQGTRDRFIVNFDTGGTAQLRRTAGSWTIGAGGFGRALAGYGFTHVSLLTGIEFGGGALLEPNTRPTAFAINYLPALPVILRLQRNAWNLDLEAASVALFQAGNTRLSYGARAGVTVGISSLRLRGILPWVGLGIASEYHFANSARPGAFYLRSGLRVGGVWDP